MKKTKKQKVWVLTSGCYSDYRIEALFSTKELADKAMTCTREANEPFLMEIDQLADKVKRGQSVWCVWMSRDGHSDGGSQFGLDWQVDEFHISDDKQNCRFLNFASDEQHAIKICNEKRIQAIAAGLM